MLTPDAGSAPTAFLSHASEDKAEFAEPLGRELARLGIQPWLDKWEILPGDSLVQKLFDEGLSRTDAVLVIVSNYSAGKKWVREELDHATVQRIERGTRLIPIRLDNADMPAPLQHLKWVNADRSAASVQVVAREIADTLHGRELRPAVGPVPQYVTAAAQISGLTTGDSHVLGEIVRSAISTGRLIVDWGEVKQRLREAGMSDEAVTESLHALGESHAIDVSFGYGDVMMLKLTRHGYATAVETVVPDIIQVHRRIIACLVNTPPSGDQACQEIAEQAQTEPLVVEQLLADLQDRELVAFHLTLGGSYVHGISPTLGRLLT